MMLAKAALYNMDKISNMFSDLAPTPCNIFLIRTIARPTTSLPVHVREETDFYRFKRLLKTHTFSLAYNVH